MEIKKMRSDENNLLEDNLNITKKFLTEDYPLHWHDFFEIEFIRSGNGLHLLNNKEIPMKQGYISLLTPNDFHEIKVEQPMDLINIQFPASLIEEGVLRHISNPANRFECLLEKGYYEELNFLAEALCVGKTKSLQFRKNILDSMLGIIINNSGYAGNRAGTGFSNNTVDKARLYMTMHFKNNPSLQEIADYVGLNPCYFSRVFVKETGKSPIHYMADMKLAYAKTLITTTSLSVTEIAFACGFGSFTNFLKQFKSHFGITPKEMRK